MSVDPAVAAVRLAVRRTLAAHPGRPVLVACSGGADSLALAAATAFECAAVDRPHALITVDHQLQPGSAAVARRVAQLGWELGFCPVTVAVVEVGRDGGPEAAARSARYAAIEQVRGPDDALLLLGHTADDQAETVLLGLGRGSGPRSIAGMRPEAPDVARPLLGLRRSDTLQACRALGLEVWDDPQNADPAYRRVRIRAEVIPLLEDVLAGGVVPALARTAALLADDLDALAELAERLLDTARCDAGLAVRPLLSEPRAVVTRCLKRWAETSGCAPLGARHVAELLGLVVAWHGQGPIDLPGGFRATRSSGTLSIRPPA